MLDAKKILKSLPDGETLCCLAFFPELNVILESKELKDTVDDGDDEGAHEEIDVRLQERLLHAVLVLVVFLLPHQAAQHVEPVFILLCSVFT